MSEKELPLDAEKGELSADRNVDALQDGDSNHASGQESKQYESVRAQRTEPWSGATSRPNSLRMVPSQRSYAGGDGYTYFSEDNDSAPREQHRHSGEDRDKTFEVKWDDGDNDPMNPRSKSKAQRWVIVLILAGSSLCVTCVSSLYTSIYNQVVPEFNSSRIVATLGLSLYVLGLGLGPMFLAPLSEFYGRRPIYVGSFVFFIIWLIPCAVAQNMATLLIARFFDGLAGAAFLSVAGGTVGDIFSKADLSMPMMIYTASPFVGPEVGPLIGGFINQYTTWRWSFYALLIWAGVQLVLIATFVPETYHPVLLKRKAQMLRKTTGNEAWKAPIERLDRSITRTVLWSCVRPFQLLVLEPMCLCLCILSAILLGILYLFFGAFPIVFQQVHGFSQSQNGLAFLGILIGMMIGISTDPLWRRLRERLVQQREAEGGEPGGSEPEYRLPPTVAGAPIVPIALFGFGWTTFGSIHWIVPIVFSALFGLSIIWVYAGVFTFLVDCYPTYAASALAANSFARSSFAAAFPLFGVQMYNRLGNQWATSLLAFLSLVMAPFPYLFYRYGKRLRAHSKFAT